MDQFPLMRFTHICNLANLLTLRSRIIIHMLKWVATITEDTVNTECQHTVVMGPYHMSLNPNQKNTELKKCLHMEDTVNTEYQHTEDTVNRQHMVDTVVTRSLNLKTL